MKKIIEFKSRKQKFKEWLSDVLSQNFNNNQEVSSVLIIWETNPSKDSFQAMHARFNCDLDNLKWFYRELGEKIKEMEFDKYLCEHLHEYIEF